MTEGVVRRTVPRWRGQWAPAAPDDIAEEVAVALTYNGISHAVMMASPGDLDDFALGFSLTEGLLDSPAELYGVEQNRGPEGITLALEVAAAAAFRLKERRRNLAGRTGCGLCGTDSLAMVRRVQQPVRAVQVAAAAIARAEEALRGAQPLQNLTGATHAAAWADMDGRILLLREDLGRHNALDKLIGALVRQRTDPASGFLLVSSRASFEMVQKAAAFGAGVLAAVSAPTSLAIELAEQTNLALAGYVRGGGCVAYTFPERLGAR
ncbi:formate dehydrogenase accessory sulfurtransferase FdhD [Massilia sp. TS11]|uniref:formate dehydrogenase accessory sulfurtransferase FdhD n=1 Tax=Massilia sp. TS11 TaxID=2908003 RepID=UPI001EDA946E|nr:formate dehydrogenase accessory sulfurtransferase FdhD [Massilia sp. TS11]MCG2584947.1 formate dehydrogenase accessory sulfurtransferase FdhD [Massilia sp. TS11]